MTTILAIDGAFAPFVAALRLSNGQWLHASLAASGQPHSQLLLPLLQSLLNNGGLTLSQIEMLALATGPGSFTGLRIAAATLAGLNIGIERPVVAVSSLAVTAIQSGCPDELLVLEDARAGDLYVGHYQQGRALTADRLMRWEEVAQLPSLPIATTAASEVVVRRHLPQAVVLPTTMAREDALARCVEHSFAEQAARLSALIPHYLGVSQAERSASHPTSQLNSQLK